MPKPSPSYTYIHTKDLHISVETGEMPLNPTHLTEFLSPTLQTPLILIFRAPCKLARLGLCRWIESAWYPERWDLFSSCQTLFAPLYPPPPPPFLPPPPSPFPLSYPLHYLIILLTSHKTV